MTFVRPGVGKSHVIDNLCALAFSRPHARARAADGDDCGLLICENIEFAPKLKPEEKRRNGDDCGLSKGEENASLLSSLKGEDVG